MPLEKIKEAKYPCLDPQHNPPMNIVLEPGATYRYTCPSCGEAVEFMEPLITNSI